MGSAWNVGPAPTRRCHLPARPWIPRLENERVTLAWKGPHERLLRKAKRRPPHRFSHFLGNRAIFQPP